MIPQKRRARSSQEVLALSSYPESGNPAKTLETRGTALANLGNLFCFQNVEHISAPARSECGIESLFPFKSPRVTCALDQTCVVGGVYIAV
jgi:hypothetical protein